MSYGAHEEAIDIPLEFDYVYDVVFDFERIPVLPPQLGTDSP